MERKIVSAEELRGMIQSRVKESDALDGDCRDAIINSVYWHAMDENGNNWDVHSVRNAIGCEQVIARIIYDFKALFNIEDPK